MRPSNASVYLDGKELGTVQQRLPQYKNSLTPSQLADGMNAATRNAKRLFNDASLLIELGRYSSAAALAILSIEESGKHRVLRELALARNQDEVRNAWREYRQHTSKNQLWLFVQTALRGASRLEDFRELFDPDAEHPYVLEQLKQVSLYTDCLGSAQWSIPDDVVDLALAQMLTNAAEVLCQSHEVTPLEMELWIAHLQPVYRTTTKAMEEALIGWDRDMRQRGLLQGRNTMEDFVLKGIDVRKQSHSG